MIFTLPDSSTPTKSQTSKILYYDDIPVKAPRQALKYVYDNVQLEMKQDYTQTNLRKGELTFVVNLNLPEQLDHITGIDLLCMVDVSSSMNGDKAGKIRQALIQVLQHLSPQDRLCLIVFNHCATRLFPFMPINSDTSDVLVRGLIDNIQCEGSTVYQEAFALAHKCLIERKEVNDVTSIFFLSDGLDLSPSNSAIREYLKSFPFLPVYTFGLGDTQHHKLLKDISLGTGGAYQQILSTALLPQLLKTYFAELRRIIGTQMLLDVRPHRGAQIRFKNVLGGKFISSKGENLQTCQPVARWGQSRELLFQFEYELEENFVHEQSLVAIQFQIKQLDTQQTWKKRIILKLKYGQQDQSSKELQVKTLKFCLLEALADAQDSIQFQNKDGAYQILKAHLLKLQELPDEERQELSNWIAEIESLLVDIEKETLKSLADRISRAAYDFQTWSLKSRQFDGGQAGQREPEINEKAFG